LNALGRIARERTKCPPVQTVAEMICRNNRMPYIADMLSFLRTSLKEKQVDPFRVVTSFLNSANGSSHQEKHPGFLRRHEVNSPSGRI